MPNSVLINLLKTLQTSKIRGRTRLTVFSANRFKSLQSVPQKIHGGIIHLDLRATCTHEFLSSAQYTEEHEIMKQIVKEGDVVLDIGANIGVYTVWLSSLVGKNGVVFAFEPNPLIIKTLEKTVAALQNTTLLSMALSDENAETTFFVPENYTMASLKDWTESKHGKVKQIKCQTRRLDDLIEEGTVKKPDFIKCDIEGGETACFLGAKSLLNSQTAPSIIFEMNINTTRGYGIGAASAMNFLQLLEIPKYRFFQIESRNKLSEINNLESYHANVLAVPSEKISLLINREINVSLLNSPN